MLKIITHLKQKLLSFLIFKNCELSASIFSQIPFLSSKTSEILWKKLLKEKISSSIISQIVSQLTSVDGIMGKEQREEMLKYLLSQPISGKQQEMMASACKVEQISKEARKNLWEKLSQYPVPSENISSIIHALIDSRVMQKEQREEMLEYLLSQPISGKQQEMMASACKVEQISKEARKNLWEKLSQYPVPSENISSIIHALIDSRVMQKEQREEMLEYLLSQPISGKQQEMMTSACKVEQISKEARKNLWEKLSQYSVPSENISSIIHALIDSRVMQKEQREEMLEYLLSQPISGKQQEMMTSACKVEQISKEARKNLWEKLSQYSVPSESISSIIHALIQSKVMQKKQREEMLSYLLSCPLSTKQMKECILKAVEFSTNHKIFEFSKIFESYLNFQNAINNLTPWIDEERLEWKNGKETALKKVLFEGIIPQDALLDLICTEHICYLKDACIEFIDRKQLWLMMEELLFSEEYYCQFSCKEPYVLDCGTNIGLAIYYIKHYYPEAHIEGFEPWKTAFDCAVRNVERNGWKNVTIHHAAVGGKEDVMQLTVVAENSLAGSLAGRLDEMIERKHWEKSVENVKVVKLSDYINRPVNFVKMDIEGLENEVIEEIKEKLPNISQMFVEYHYGSSMKNNSLIEILKILSDAGFVYQISKSLSYTELTRKRPFAHVGKMVSELIWAVKK